MPAIAEMHPTNIKPRSKTRAILRAFGLLSVLVWAWKFEDIEKRFPDFVNTQVKFHQCLSRLDPRQPRAERVLLVEIDDATFWHPPVSGKQPTNRRFIADLAKIAAEAGAIVVAIDFRFLSPSSTPGDDESQKSDNEYLLTSFREITAKGVPIVVSCFLEDKGKGQWKRYPNIFADGDLPSGVRIGRINIPKDPRQIPLSWKAWEWDNSSQKYFESFAMQIADAYEEAKHISPRTRDNAVIKQATGRGEYVYGGFLKDSAFPKISALTLWKDPAELKKLCRCQIVIIGGVWHETAESQGPLIEEFPSPVGVVPGLYMHANYVEALIDNRFKLGVTKRFAVFFDLLVGLLMYFFFGLASRTASKAGVLGLFLAPLCLAYVLFANFGLYLNFALPLSLCFVHLGAELLLPESG